MGGGPEARAEGYPENYAENLRYRLKVSAKSKSNLQSIG